MGITHNDRTVFLRLRSAGLIPPRPSILELGEGAWYGDVPFEMLSEDIDDLVQDEQLREELHLRMAGILSGATDYRAWDLVKLFFRACLDYRKYTAIDFHGTPEHIFDIGQFFRTVHDLTCPGGLMVHVMPFRGWLEHGFYSFNSTFYWDLAAANGYTMLIHGYAELKPPRFIDLTYRKQILELAVGGHLGKNATLYAVMQKPATASAFRAPIQHVYVNSGGFAAETPADSGRDGVVAVKPG